MFNFEKLFHFGLIREIFFPPRFQASRHYRWSHLLTSVFDHFYDDPAGFTLKIASSLPLHEISETPERPHFKVKVRLRWVHVKRGNQLSHGTPFSPLDYVNLDEVLLRSFDGFSLSLLEEIARNHIVIMDEILFGEDSTIKVLCVCQKSHIASIKNSLSI